MLLSFLTPFKEASLQLEADTHATLLLVLPVRFNLLHHLNTLVSDTHELAQLKKRTRIILYEKFTTQIATFLLPNFWQLRIPSAEEQEDTKGDVRNLITNSVAQEPEGSSLYLQEPTNGPYPDPTGSNLHSPSQAP
jgi:hypothetical protein